MTTRSETGAARFGAGLLRHLRVGGVSSALYVWAYFATVHFIGPAQHVLLPASVMSLFFLPHGVRVLTAWLYGWRSVLYLLPGAMLCNLHFAGDRAFSPEILLGTAFSLVSAPFAFVAMRWLFPAWPLRVGVTPLRKVVLVGAVASVLNLSALTLTYGLVPMDMAVTLIGDIGGLALSLVIVWVVIRVVER